MFQGMGKYFVSIAIEAGYERTLLQLGRRVRYIEYFCAGILVDCDLWMT
jgi:hypothetical protein